MTYKERIDREKDNYNTIILHSDGGLFYNLYERSAYAFHTLVKPFKVHVKTLKALSFPYISIGVPTSKIDDYLKDFEISKENPEYIVVKLKEPIEENAFQTWKKHFIEIKETEINKNRDNNVSALNLQKDNNTSLIHQCFLEVKTLNLASVTPMEAMMFLNNLQMKLKNIDL